MSRRILRRVLFGCLGLTLVLGLLNAGWEYRKSLDRFSSEFQRLSQSFLLAWPMRSGATRTARSR